MAIQKSMWGAVGCALLTAGAHPATAQQAPATDRVTEENGGLQEIVVTAQKRSENLQNVPIAVTALSTAQIASANIDGQSMLPKLTPNLNFTFSSAFAATYIRGVGTQYASPGLESSVSVYLDDSYIPRASSALFSFNDVARIEVLKGPQGTLYGRNATGGAIRIITNDPKPEFEAAASLTYGSYDRFAIDGILNVPIADGIAVRFAARHDQNDGYVRNLAPGGGEGGARRLQDRNEEFYMGKLLIDRGPLRFKLTGDYAIKDDHDSAAFLNLYPGAPQQIGAALGGCVSTGFYNGCNDGKAFNRIESYGGAARFDYDLDSFVLSSITSYRKEKEYNCADLDSTGAAFQHGCGTPYTRQFTQELQIASQGDGPLRYVAGLYYLHERSGYALNVRGLAIDSTLGQAFGFTVPATLFSSGQGVRVRSLAPYAQLDYRVSDRFTVTLGARYTDERKKLLGNFGGVAAVGSDGRAILSTAIIPTTPCTEPAQVLCTESAKTVRFRKLTPKLTLSFRPEENTLLYATVSRGFKSGGLNLPAFGSVDSVRPETLDDFEIGWKIERGNLRWNGAIFYYDYRDLQIQITDQLTGGTRVKNAAGARAKGIETDITWVPDDRWEFGLGGGYLDTNYRNFIGDAYVENIGTPACAAAQQTPDPADDAACLGLTLTPGQPLSGNRLVNAPRFSGYLRGQYSQPVGDAGKLQFSAILNYRSKAYFDPANQFADRARTLLSAGLSWLPENDRYFIKIFGDNLFDRKYLYQRAPQATGGWRVPAPPRTLGIQVGVKL